MDREVGPKGKGESSICVVVCESKYIKSSAQEGTPKPVAPLQIHVLRRAPPSQWLLCTCLVDFFSLVSSSFHRIDEKMSGGQSGYELNEAKAILTELKSIRKAISSGEKEKQDLMQVWHRASICVCLLG